MFRTGKRHRLTSEAGKRNERGVDPTICEAAADRVAELLDDVRRRHRRRRASTVVGTPARRAARSASPRTLPGAASPGSTIDGGPRGREPARGRLPRSAARTTLTVTPPPWRPDLTDPYDLVEEVVRIVGYDQVPSVLPDAAGRARPDPRAAAAPPDRPHAGRRRLRRGDQLPVRRRRRPSTRSGCPPTTCCGTPYACRNPLSAEEPLYTTTLLPGLLDAAARNLGRGATGRRPVRDRHRRLPRRPRPGARVRRRLAAHRGRAGASSSRPSRSSRCSSAAVLAGERERAGWWGAGRAGRLVGRDRRRARARPTSSASRSRSRQPRRMPWHPSRCAGSSRSATRSSATPASCTRGSAGRTACPAAPRRSRSTSTS